MLDTRDSASSKTQFLLSQNVLPGRLLIQCSSCNHSVILGGPRGHGSLHWLKKDHLLEKMPSKTKPERSRGLLVKGIIMERAFQTQTIETDPRVRESPVGRGRSPGLKQQSAGTMLGVLSREGAY